MEAKKFISTVKGFKTRFTNKPNVELEKKSIESVVEKMGGKLEAFTVLKENDEALLTYVKSVLGIKKVTPKVETEDTEVVATSTDGKLYEIDTVKKTCKRVMKGLSELDVTAITTEMPMTTYHRFLLDKFPGEGAKLNKKGQLTFRGYRIQCNVDNGFTIEDIQKKQLVETPFEGIPTPAELGEFFKRPQIEHSPEELAAAVERGKELAKKAKEEKKRNEQPEPEVNFEMLRKKVIGKVKGIRDGKVVDFDPENIVNMIPFKRWQKSINAAIKSWKERKIRYVKLLKEIERITSEETFETKEKTHKNKFVGTVLPEFKEVGMLKGDKLEVDGKLVDAVPFLVDFILHYEPKVMPQLMRYANGVITPYELLTTPYLNDNTVEYNKRLLSNTCEHAQVLTALCESVGLAAPQDVLYVADLTVGDKIMLAVDGEWKTKTIMQIDKGICIEKEIGLLKLDKWIKLPKKNEK